MAVKRRQRTRQTLCSCCLQKRERGRSVTRSSSRFTECIISCIWLTIILILVVNLQVPLWGHDLFFCIATIYTHMHYICNIISIHTQTCTCMHANTHTYQCIVHTYTKMYTHMYAFVYMHVHRHIIIIAVITDSLKGQTHRGYGVERVQIMWTSHSWSVHVVMWQHAVNILPLPFLLFFFFFFFQYRASWNNIYIYRERERESLQT